MVVSGNLADSTFGDGFWRMAWRKIPLFVIAAASAVMTMKAQRSSGAVLSLGASPLSMRLSNALVSYVRTTLLKAFWPSGLAPMYPHPGDSLRAWQVYGALLILLIITVLVVAVPASRAICWWDGCGSSGQWFP